ncbi:hypothetical protein LX36DRAFT_715333 [Colletotrichum falcatum]|nr:hypothetical protein LX36DRAFT_715333 [Colletotrichum falcatum]
MKSISLLIAAATFMGVQAQAASCSSEENATLCWCTGEGSANTENVCKYEWATTTPIVDTDGITKCKAQAGRFFSQCDFARYCGSMEAECS